MVGVHHIPRKITNRGETCAYFSQMVIIISRLLAVVVVVVDGQTGGDTEARKYILLNTSYVFSRADTLRYMTADLIERLINKFLIELGERWSKRRRKAVQQRAFILFSC